jgi:hypothetical protein
MHPNDLLYTAIWFRERAYFLTRSQVLSDSYSWAIFNERIDGGIRECRKASMIRLRFCRRLSQVVWLRGLSRHLSAL